MGLSKESPRSEEELRYARIKVEMLMARKQGIGTLYAIMTVIALPLFFLLSVGVAVEFAGIMWYRQVDFPLYLGAVVVAVLLRFHSHRELMITGRSRFRWVHAIRQSNGDLLFLALILFGVVFATKDQAMSRLFLGSFLIGAWVFLVLFNRFAPDFLAWLFFRGENQFRTIMLGQSNVLPKLRGWFATHPSLGIEPVGIITDGAKVGDKIEGFPVIGKHNDLEEIVKRERIDQIILMDTQQTRENAERVYDCAKQFGARVLLLNNWEDYFPHPLTAINEGSLTFFAPGSEPLQNPVNRALKRALDISMAIPVVLFLLPPVLILAKLVQFRQAPGPLLVRQARGGRGKRPFPILKIRTMYCHNATPAGEARQAIAGDPRIYPFGHFLRRTSLDELPQFLNVLLGTMSAVGPRPHLLAHDEDFARYVDYYRTRHFTKPGITGMAQHLGFRGEIKSTEEIRERVRLDLEYIHNWSIWLDFGIIIKTAWHVLFPPPKAY